MPAMSTLLYSPSMHIHMSNVLASSKEKEKNATPI